jgi:hypothetical protein
MSPPDGTFNATRGKTQQFCGLPLGYQIHGRMVAQVRHMRQLLSGVLSLVRE